MPALHASGDVLRVRQGSRCGFSPATAARSTGRTTYAQVREAGVGTTGALRGGMRKAWMVDVQNRAGRDRARRGCSAERRSDAGSRDARTRAQQMVTSSLRAGERPRRKQWSRHVVDAEVAATQSRECDSDRRRRHRSRSAVVAIVAERLQSHAATACRRRDQAWMDDQIRFADGARKQRCRARARHIGLRRHPAARADPIHWSGFRRARGAAM